LGPLISEAHLQRVQGYLQLAEAQCAQWLMRGQRLGGELSRGYFLSPTLLAGVDPNSRLAQEEIFGPVLLLFPFHDEAEAIVRANATRYGLAAGVWSADLARAQRVASALRAGVVWINAYGTLPYTVPFGGWGESGFGREAGREALWEYTQPKNIYVNLQG
jgi:acyl-CoA reductase-like NAD-dependent aldehyde dehydrogenase